MDELPTNQEVKQAFETRFRDDFNKAISSIDTDKDVAKAIHNLRSYITDALETTYPFIIDYILMNVFIKIIQMFKINKSDSVPHTPALGMSINSYLDIRISDYKMSFLEQKIIMDKVILEYTSSNTIAENTKLQYEMIVMFYTNIYYPVAVLEEFLFQFETFLDIMRADIDKFSKNNYETIEEVVNTINTNINNNEALVGGGVKRRARINPSAPAPASAPAAVAAPLFFHGRRVPPSRPLGDAAPDAAAAAAAPLAAPSIDDIIPVPPPPPPLVVDLRDNDDDADALPVADADALLADAPPDALDAAPPVAAAIEANVIPVPPPPPPPLIVDAPSDDAAPPHHNIFSYENIFDLNSNECDYVKYSGVNYYTALIHFAISNALQTSDSITNIKNLFNILLPKSLHDDNFKSIKLFDQDNGSNFINEFEAKLKKFPEKYIYKTQIGKFIEALEYEDAATEEDIDPDVAERIQRIRAVLGGRVRTSRIKKPFVSTRKNKK